MTMPSELYARFKDWPIFTINDAYLFLKSRHKVSKKTVQVTLSRMVKSGRLYGVLKGTFSFNNSTDTAGFAYSPFYYGGMAALMIRDLIDDQVVLEVMTTKTVRRRMVKILGDARIVLHHIPKKYFFGFNDTQYGYSRVPVSDPEKTLIDLFYYKIVLSIQDYAEVLKAVNKQKLSTYLKVYDRHTRISVLNFIKKYKKKADRGELTSPY